MELKKYKKYHKKKNIWKKEKINLIQIKKGSYGFKLLNVVFITPNQIETMRRIISRITRRLGKISINVNCNFPLTKKPLASRMGKGVGVIHKWVGYLKQGKIVIEIQDIPEKVVLLAFNSIKRRMGFKMQLVKRETIDI